MTAYIETLRSWGTVHDTFELAQGDFGSVQTGAAARAELRVRADPAISISVESEAGDPRIWLVSRLSLSSELRELMAENRERGDAIRQLVRAQSDLLPGTAACTLLDEGRPASVEVRAVIYADAFSRHALNATVVETMKARRTIETLLLDTIQGWRLASEVEQSVAEDERELERLRKESEEELKRSAQEEARRAQEEARWSEEQGRLKDEEARRAAEELEIQLRQTETQLVPVPGSETCATCEAALTPGAKFCTSCGSVVTVTEVPSAPARNCSNCGANLTPGAKFCLSCGTPVA